MKRNADNTIILMLDALADAPREAVLAADKQGYNFYHFSEGEPRPEKLPEIDVVNRIEAIAKSRNNSRQWLAQKNLDYDWIVLVDSDVVLPENAVDNLCQSDYKVAGGWVPVRGSAERFIAGRYKSEHDREYFTNFNYPRKDPVISDMTTLACCIMPRDCFEKISVRHPKPNEWGIDSPYGKVAKSEPLCYGDDLHDLYGLRCVVIPDVICNHIGV